MFKLEAVGIRELIICNKKFIERLKRNEDFETMLDAIVIKARHNCPVDTGRLMKSIRWEKRGYGRYVIICDVPYSRFIEYGTRYYPIGSVESPRGYKSTSGKMASVPFLRSAIWDVGRDFPGKINKVIDVIYN